MIAVAAAASPAPKRPYGKYRLGYIAYGRLLATGTPEEVLHVFSLDTWHVCGPRARLAQLPHELRGKPGWCT
jgi:ABC-2 type transport system ATP-binding protein